MCLALALTAARLGTTVANYTQVTQLVKTSDGFVGGAKVKDGITGRQGSKVTATEEVCVSVCVCL